MKYDYFYADNLYSKEECDLLRSKLYEITENKLAIRDVPAQNTTKTSEVRFFKAGSVLEQIEKLRSAIIEINKNVFKFNCFDFSDEDILYFNIYDHKTQAEYSWHSDGVKDQLFDIKITALVNLSSDDYEGGDFSLFLNGEYPVPEFKKTGSAVFFPSWVQHRVQPVTTGTRYSLTYFVSGPCLQ